MNLTIHERHGGGFYVELTGDNFTALLQTEDSKALNRSLVGVHGVQGMSDTLTLTFGSINAPPVTFETFSDLQRVLHGEVRLSLERLDDA